MCDIKFDEVEEDGPLFTVSNCHGQSFHSKAVVLAVGPGLTKSLPWELSPTEEQGACHSSEIGVKFPSPSLTQKLKERKTTNLVVIGGGLSSAQIDDMAIRMGVSRVWHLIRGDLKVKHFDVSLNWVGKFKNYDKAVFWSADDDKGEPSHPRIGKFQPVDRELTTTAKYELIERIEMLQTARNGGSITPHYHKILKQHIQTGRLSIHTRTVIDEHTFDPTTQTWKITTTPPIADFPSDNGIDYICFATGMQTNINEMRLLQSMIRDYPVESLNGLPCLTDDLMWKAGIPLFVTGRLASLRLGPAAPNLEGARLGAERIAWALQDVLGDGQTVDYCSRSVKELQQAFCGLGNRYESLDCSE